MKYLFLSILLISFASCTNPEKASEALTKSGYSDIETGGYGWLACGRDDQYSTKFTATNPVGMRVSGTVCAGLFFKGATIRF